MYCNHLWMLLGHMGMAFDAVRCRYCGIDARVECGNGCLDDDGTEFTEGEDE